MDNYFKFSQKIPKLKKSKKDNNNFPFANEIQLMKFEFNNMIDSMSDHDFLDLLSFFSLWSDSLEDENWIFDEEWENETEKIYNIEKNKSINFDEDDSLPFQPCIYVNSLSVFLRCIFCALFFWFYF